MTKISIISHDAGGAEYLSSWAKHQNQKINFVLEGPAINIFKKKIPYINLISLDEALKSSDVFICGTSWQSDIEKKSILIGKKYGKLTISFLDHWVNYEERFLYKGRIILPDQIWVSDGYALKIAKNIFPNSEVKLKRNYYLNDIKENYLKKFGDKKNFKKDSFKVLFTAENIKDHAFLKYGDERYWGYTEDDAIKYFLENLRSLKLNINEIKIRPHPSDPTDKYFWALKNKLVKSINSNKSLIEDIASVDIVAGCESMAMVSALFLKKKVISCIPPEGRKCSLPHDRIIHLRDII